MALEFPRRSQTGNIKLGFKNVKKMRDETRVEISDVQVMHCNFSSIRLGTTVAPSCSYRLSVM